MKKGLTARFAGATGWNTVSKLHGDMEVVGLLLRLGSCDTGPTPQQKAALQADDDRRKAAIALDDANRLEGVAEEDRRAAYFANKGPA